MLAYGVAKNEGLVIRVRLNDSAKVDTSLLIQLIHLVLRRGVDDYTLLNLLKNSFLLISDLFF